MLQSKTFRTRSIGWALFGVNFRPLQKIEAIMGDGRIFDTGPFFARLRYVHICILIVTEKVLIGVHTHIQHHTHTSHTSHIHGHNTPHTPHTPHTTPHLTPTHTHASHRAHSKLSCQVEWKRIQFRAFHRRGSVEIESGTSVYSR